MTISSVVMETCKTIWSVLHPIYIRNEYSMEEWEETDKQYEGTWNFPHCIFLNCIS
jgi:hypothetical protein